MTKPCSVIIPTYNRPELLVRAVTSARAALPKGGEIFVIDDRGEVSASESLAALVGPDLTVLQNEKQLGGGGSPSRNNGAQASSGRVLFFLDDDDEFLPHYCTSILSSDAAMSADFGFSARQFANTDGDGSVNTSQENRGLPEGRVSARQPFSKRSFPFSAGFWITREAYEAVGRLAETLATNSDTEYCCRLYAAGLKGWFAREPGVIIHAHPPTSTGQMTNVTKRTKAADRAASFRYMAQTHKEFLATDTSAASFVHQRWLKHTLRAGQTADAWAAVSKAPGAALRTRLAVQGSAWVMLSKLGLD